MKNNKKIYIIISENKNRAIHLHCENYVEWKIITQVFSWFANSNIWNSLVFDPLLKYEAWHSRENTFQFLRLYKKKKEELSRFFMIKKIIYFEHQTKQCVYQRFHSINTIDLQVTGKNNRKTSLQHNKWTVKVPRRTYIKQSQTNNLRILINHRTIEK